MKNIWRYLITASAGILFAVIYMFIRKIYDAESANDVFRILCESFFLPGFLLVCVSGLAFVAREGTFDMLVFGLKTLVNIFKGTKNEETFYDYRERLGAKEKQPILYLLLVGVAILLISFIFAFIYYYTK